MIKIIIADDEPLVQIGLKSMIDWSELGAEICGTASNGDAAYDLILKYHPDIVITDIQMPCSSGLQLGRTCRENLGPLPVFLILTSYEEFSYAKEALSFQAVDYLVKIDLSPDILTAAIRKAIKQVELLKRQLPASDDSQISLSLFQDRFYIRLLYNLFENREQYFYQAKEFHIHLDTPGFVAANLGFSTPVNKPENPGHLSSFKQALEMCQELTSKYLPCHLVVLDTKYASAILCVSAEHLADYEEYIRKVFSTILEMLHNYYNVSLFISFGRLVSDPLDLSDSYYDSKQITKYLSDVSPILFWDEIPDIPAERNVFNFSIFRNDIVKAFEELDADTLNSVFTNMSGLLSGENVRYSQAMDAAGNILHLSIALMEDGHRIVSDIFSHEPDSYHSLYRQKNIVSILEWLERLRQGLNLAFEKGRQNYQNSLSARCCQYINSHIRERIYLQDIANALEISPNYLSQVFKKHMGIGISEYITNKKIEVSKNMLKETNMKIYEISDARSLRKLQVSHPKITEISIPDL